MNIHTVQISRAPRLLAIAAVAFGAATATTSSALGAPFQISQCHDTDGTTSVASFASPIATQPADNCVGGNGASYTADSNVVAPSGQAWQGAGFGWQLPDSVPNTDIERVWASLSLADKIGDDSFYSYGDLGVWNNGVQSGPGHAIPARSGVVEGFSGVPMDSTLGSGARAAQVLVRCYYSCRFNGPILTLHRAVLVLNEETLPEPPAYEPVGILDGALQSGTRTLRTALRDSDSGVHSVWVATQSGVQVGSALGGSGCSYTRPSPCPQYRGQVDIKVDTTRLPEGTQTLEVWTADAANNVRRVFTPNITVDNIPAPALAGEVGTAGPRAEGNSQVGQTLTAFDGRWTGSGVSFSRQWQVSEDGETWKNVAGATAATWRPEASHAGKLVRVVVTASSNEGSTQAASAGRRVEAASGAGGGVIVGGPSETASLTPDNGAGGKAVSGRLVASSKSEKLRTGYKKRTRVSGQLVDESGTPITGAEIDVYEKVITSRAERRKVATITTDAKGAYVYESRPTSSRTAELAYSRQRGSTTYQSTHAVRLQVQAGVQARLSRGWVPSRGLVTLKGRVLASDLPKNGVIVQVQARDRGKWIAAGLTRTKQDGRFTWKYRLRATSGQIPFRAVLRRTGDLPATVNSSRVVKVRIG
jgi:hypothetical protein